MSKAAWMRKVSMTLSLVVLFASFSAVSSAKQDLQEGERVDVIEMGPGGNEDKHHATIEGDSGAGRVSERIGQRVQTYDTRYLRGTGSSVSYTANVTPGQPITLDIQEVHPREEAFISYDIYIDGVKTYARSYQVRGAGPNHYFVAATGGRPAEDSDVEIRLVNRYDGEVHLGGIKVYSGFGAIAAAERADAPMLLSILVPIGYEKYEDDLALVRNVGASLRGNDRMSIGFGVQLRYAKWTPAEVERQIDYILSLSHDSGLPVNIQFDTWWGGTPNGPDGEGGYWSDVAYQQVVYDPERGYGLSIPNQWSSTPWLTVGNERFNAFKRERLKQHLAYLAKRYAEMKAEGKHPVVSGLVMDSEPAYWAVGMPGATPNQSADFNPAMTADAARDGVALDPADGLSLRERVWLLERMTRYNASIADAMKEGLGNGSVVASGADAGAVGELPLSASIYSQGFDEVKFPFHDDVYRFWETALVDGANLGTEWTFVDARQSLEYQAAQGRTANTNLEASMLGNNFESIALAYANGLDMVFIYNLAPGQYAALQQAIDRADRPYEPQTYSLTLLEQNFKSDDYLQDVYSIDNLQVRTDWEWNLSATDTSRPGSVIYRVSDAGKALDRLTVSYYARAINYFDGQDGSKRMRIYAGTAPDALELVHELSKSGPVRHTVDLSAQAAGRAELFVKFELDAAGLPGGLESWVGLQEVAFGIQGDKSGHTDPTASFTDRETRALHRWVGAAKEAEKLLSTHRATLEAAGVLSDMERLYEEGRYNTVRDAIYLVLRDALPARYTVRGGGALGGYPVRLALDDANATVHATVTDIARDRLALTISAAADQTGALTFGVGDNGYYALEANGNDLAIVRSAGNRPGAAKAENGEVSFAIAIAGNAAEVDVSVVTGDFRAYRAGFRMLHVRPDDPRYAGAELLALPLAADAVVLRGEAGAPEPAGVEQIQVGEQVTVTRNEAGEAVRVEAVYGSARVSIAEMRQMTPYAMGSLMDDQGATYVFDLDTVLNLKQQSGKVRDMVGGRIELSPGDVVALTYNPSTRRIIGIQDSILLLFEDFESADPDAWKSKAYAYANVRTEPVDQNYPQRGLVPDDMSGIGEVTYRVESGNESFGKLGLSYKTRVIAGQLNYLKIYAGPTPDALTLLADLRPEIGGFNESRGLDLTDVAQGRDELYVKFEMKTQSFNSWTYLGEIAFRESFTAE